jgi:GDP-mannose 6-dehydrogenase
MASISVFGLGYVGCVSAACLAREGHEVVGVDVNPAKVDLVNRGLPTILEEGIGELVAAMVTDGRLRATTDPAEAVAATGVSLVCVGTPSRPNASLDLGYVERVSEEIGAALRGRRGGGRHTVVIRSTVLPGTVDEVVVPALERGSGGRRGEAFAVCANPEFLREGTSIRDYYDPPFTLIGADDPEAEAVVRGLYAGIRAPVHVVAVRVAEMVKYACNAFHGLKVGFANEIGNVCKALGVDSHEVMRVFCEDRKLNISPAYLRPGFAFGGSCLPKDIRAVTYRAGQLDVETPILRATLESNRRQIERAFDLVMAAGSRKVGILGMSFKEGTDDLRESPMVALIEMLIGKGCELAIYDRDVSQSRLMGANKEYIEREIPHVWTLVRRRLDDVLAASDVLVVGNATVEFRELGPRLRPGQVVVDLVRVLPDGGPPGVRYEGIAW